MSILDSITASKIVKEDLRLIEQGGDQAKIEWLRVAAKEGFDAVDRGDYISLRTGEEVDALMNEIHGEVVAGRQK